MKKILISLAVLLAVLLIPASVLSKSQGTAGVVLLDENNTLVLNGEVNGENVGAVITKAKELDAKLSSLKESVTNKKPLYLYLSTPGGSIISGMELIEALKGLGRPVHTITFFAASMGFQIAQNLNTRYILKSGELMSHHAAGEFGGQFGGKAPNQLESRMRLWKQIVKELDMTTVKRTNGKQTLESYQAAYDPELWLTGPEAVAEGYADQITLVKCGVGLIGTTKHNLDFLGFKISYELDNCPINSSPMNVSITPPPGTPPGQAYEERVLNQFKENYQLRSMTPIKMTL